MLAGLHKRKLRVNQFGDNGYYLIPLIVKQPIVKQAIVKQWLA